MCLVGTFRSGLPYVEAGKRGGRVVGDGPDHRVTALEDPPLLANVHVQGVGSIVALVDTGALGQSAIRESKLSAARHLITPWRGPAVAIANGEPYAPSGEVELLVTFADKTVRLQSVAVIPGLPCPIALGLDWINRCKPKFEYVN